MKIAVQEKLLSNLTETSNRNREAEEEEEWATHKDDADKDRGTTLITWFIPMWSLPMRSGQNEQVHCWYINVV